MNDDAVFLALALLHLVAKGLTHQTQDQAWARKRLFQCLPISDAYHVFSGLMWPVFVQMGWLAWGSDWRWWMAGLVLGGLLWPLTKFEKARAIGWRAILAEAWYVQIALLPWKRRPRRV